MNLTKQQIEKAITLKQWYAQRLRELRSDDDEVGLQFPRDAERVIRRVTAFEGTHHRNLFKEFLEELSRVELQELQAVAFYGRSEYRDFAVALEDAKPGQDEGEIDYTMNLIAASDYLEAGFERLNNRREI